MRAPDVDENFLEADDEDGDEDESFSLCSTGSRESSSSYNSEI